ncbi:MULTISPECIES: type ISP restriction/modification enzyme [unclassified Lactobacillus]|uniref:type ISP restriction/modification enzyme n=1 Tax=unclassified Lactobacillus TaxID=2620435 RepID=UPI000EFAECDB|nr:hypothetical protein F5ESL0247_02255 [Lactobacillus sp. ESL0247]RMC29071.1 hypothetical protein F5ESL0246_02255 [Lactobacillus sp. ESL0246]RMC32674.1 hypothetical protein F5ESL0245_02255 [Lactobacillus sp. ESL0245]
MKNLLIKDKYVEVGKKIKFAKKKDSKTGKKINVRSTIVYNDILTISDISEIAYEYIVNVSSAIEWIMVQ